MHPLVGIWSSYEAEGYGTMEDELYVLLPDGVGVSVYFNALASTFELFRWADDDGTLALDPMRAVFVEERDTSRAVVEREPAMPSRHQYQIRTAETCWRVPATELLLVPSRGTGT